MSGISPIARYELPPSTSLPAPRVGWQIDMQRSALLIHDMQQYFLKPFDSEFRNTLTRNCAKVRDRFTGAGAPVFYTAQPGGMSDADRGLLKDFWGPGMRVDPTDREIVEGLSPRMQDTVLTKWRYSAFFKSDLLREMRQQGRSQLVICGVYGHVGILATALESFANDIETFLVADAIGDFSLQEHRMMLEYASGRCAVVLAAEDVT